ncbi:MAG: SufB/SufD family protein [Bacillota bacterium]
MNDYKMMVDAYQKAGGEDIFSDSEVAHVVLERDKILGMHAVDGLEVEADKIEKNKVQVKVTVREGYKIKNPVHMCFGVLPKEGKQIIDMQVEIEKDAAVEVRADCVFPNAVEVQHIMDAQINIAAGGSYIYQEHHFHGEHGGVEVIAKSDINVEAQGKLVTKFDLLKGRVGKIDFDYEAQLAEAATVEMLARISGQADDLVKIREAAHLNGKNSRGILDSKIALKDQAKAEIYNELTADAAGAMGHVDCTEIIKDQAIARAIPIVDVRHPGAKVTHEAAIGSVDSTQLQTLMARGLDEEDASEVIIQGLLND